MLNKVEGHFVFGYSAGGDEPSKRLELVPGAVQDAEEFLSDDEETMSRFNRVAELVAGFETPFGLELLSTVHWVATQEGAADADAVVSSTYAWNDRKKIFSRRQILLAYNKLAEEGWLDLRPTGHAI